MIEVKEYEVVDLIKAEIANNGKLTEKTLLIVMESKLKAEVIEEAIVKGREIYLIKSSSKIGSNLEF